MLKENLKTICDYEAELYKRHGIVDKTERAIKGVEETGEKRIADLRNELVKAKEEATEKEHEVNNYNNDTPTSTVRKIVTCISLIAITWLLQLLFYWCINSVIKATSPLGGAFACSLIPIIAFAITALCTIPTGEVEIPSVFAVCLVIYFLIFWGYFALCLKTGLTLQDSLIAAGIILTSVCIIGTIIYHYRNIENVYERNKLARSKKQETKELCISFNQTIAKKQNEMANYEAKYKNALYLMDVDLRKQKSDIAAFEVRLNNLYAQSGLHPNYQNWIAASAIYSYLDTRRCYQLEGPDGAYNLYEAESRTDKLIETLSGILSYTGSIAASQYNIRSQLADCASQLRQITINRYGF